MQEVESMHAAFLIFGLTQVAQSCFFVCILSIVFYSSPLHSIPVAIYTLLRTDVPFTSAFSV